MVRCEGFEAEVEEEREDEKERWEDVWYAAAREGVGAGPLEEGGEGLPGSASDAVAIERRDRTRSSGYVEPADHG